MTLRPIDDASLGDAIALLSRGFPERTCVFWEASLRRLTAYRKGATARPIGQLMVVDGKAVGVILTIASRRFDGATAREVVNLSSWYIDAPYRWLASRMLQSIVADDSVTYTDLTPTEQTERINARIGFRRAAEGLVLYFLPWAAIAGPSRARVVPFERLPPDALLPADRTLLAHHRELGCLAAALYLRGYHPLLFQPTRRKGLPVARLVLAESRRLVTDNVGAIARFLLRSRMLFLSLYGDSVERTRGGIIWNRSASMLVKGSWQPERVDHTYSELVFLRL